MNILLTISEAMQTTRELDRDSQSLFGLCGGIRQARAYQDGNYSAYLRRRSRSRQAA